MPASEKQIAANRRNALKSTGPRTPEGKERSRANATTHGLTAAITINRPIRHENPTEFHEMRGALLADCQPVGAREQMCVEMMAAAYKRIQRAEAWEAAFFDGAMDATQLAYGRTPEATGHDDLGCSLVLGQRANKLSWENLDRYRRAAWADYNRAQEQLRRLQKERLDAPVRELRIKKMQEDYLRRTHVATQTSVPAREMASFRPEPVNTVVPVAAEPNPQKYPEAA